MFGVGIQMRRFGNIEILPMANNIEILPMAKNRINTTKICKDIKSHDSRAV